MREKTGFFHLAFFCILIFAAFYTYRYGIVALPRGDQIGFMRERELASSDWQYFWRMLVRNRLESPIVTADFFVFRPLFHAILALIDIFFRHNLYVIGGIGIFLHALASFSFYYLIDRLTKNRVLAMFLSIFLLVQYPGMEMVYWAHINPYLVALILLSFAFIRLLNFEEGLSPKRELIAIGFIFFLIALIQDLFAFSLLFSGLLFLLIFKQKKIFYAKLCLIPFLIYFVLDTATFVILKQTSFLSPLDNLAKLTFWSAANGMFSVGGLLIGTLFMPNLVTLVFPALVYQAQWDFTKLQSVLVSTFGIIFFLLLGLGFIFYMTRLRKTSGVRAVIGIMLIVYLATIVAGLGILRIPLRSFIYLKSATYYFYIFTYIALLTITILIEEIFKTNQARGHISNQRVISGLVGFFFLWQIPYSYTQIQKTLEPNYKKSVFAAEATKQISNYLSEHPGYCYGGTPDTAFWTILPSFLLYRFWCSDSLAQKPLYGSLFRDGKIWYFGYQNTLTEFKRSALTEVNFEKKDISNFNLDSFKRDAANEQIYLSDEPFALVRFDVRFSHAGEAGLIVGYSNPKNFIYLLLKRHHVYLGVVQNGVLVPRLLRAAYLRNTDDFMLSVVKVNKSSLFFLFDDNILISYSGIESLEGKAGFWFSVNDEKIGSFPAVSAWETGANLPDSLYLTPVFKTKPRTF